MGLLSKKPKLSDLTMFCNQIAVMQDSGMPLVRTLEILEIQMTNDILSKAIGNMVTKVSKGESLTSAMGQYPKVFPKMMCNMVAAGEESGQLQNSFEKLEVHYEKEDNINSEIKGAMIYPIVLIIISVFAVAFLLIFVMPTIAGMFTGSGTELPLPTRIVMGLSDLIKNYWYIIVGAIGGTVLILKKVTASGPGKKMKDAFFLKIPIVGKNVRSVVTSRYTRTMSTLLSSGVPILDSINLAVKIADNNVLTDKMEYVQTNIQKGQSFGLLLSQINFFPDMMVSMVEIGEESGSLARMLEKAADYYDKELEKSLKALVGLIEPLAIIFMGITIGGIVVAMMLPMFDMFKTIG